ncbi:sigma-54-dependent Fis family transcriptional regulator [candidate division KSB3 bacterium]|uniref:Sigma-54-dependent Fis family transcriptional regulator n=1 Tax=candidate division KSB3 bacterium TaxID=2044937 RepID=A0A2G6E4Q5_9BACT|nr:MAG: sigma-54-dependent Fis family transcriptional regulator [candidate division KSB3 bacterium]PIE29639.1 MAG: sigma-54-dependent Fis family transcriptional regulator [candidate division KSB3 bacterium]
MSAETPAASILIVDDTPDNLRLLAGLLEEEGYDVRPASSGTRALSAVQADLPDLILLDIKMPDMPGYEVCERLKSDMRTCHIPIIFISALQDTSEKIKGFALGGVDYITKPFQAEEVLARVETHLALQRLRHHLEEEVHARTLELRQEIAEREQAQYALQKSEQQYRLLVKKVTDGIGVFQEQRLIFLNEALASMFDSSQEKLLGRSPEELFGREQQRKASTARQFEPDSRDVSWEVFEFSVGAQGHEFWLEGHQRSIIWEGSSALLVTIRDISERKRKERELARERLQLRRENVRLRSAMKERYRFGKIIGKSPAMQEVYELITRASATDVNVVIYGESGTGKDLIAQTIHEMSSRRKKAFVPVNCGSIQEGVFEREFFGHRKGAFTGALRDHPGFFDAAHEGTLFLDEVGELNPAMQVKLLRAIDTKSYLPMGEQKAKQADARIVAATNRNLQEHVKQGLMRQDFFYRINVIPMLVPPLRARREDIPLLVEHFLQLYYADFRQDVLPGEIMETLYDYDWPGNIRQLQNVLLRYLTLHKLDFDENDTLLPEKTANPQGMWQAVKALEKRLIIEGLSRNQGHKTNTAKMLQIPLRTLRRKIQEYRLE